MNAPACQHCRSTIPITNDLGDKRCSGCGRDWTPRATGLVTIAFDDAPLREGVSAVVAILAEHEARRGR